jgi:hypothetical protein
VETGFPRDKRGTRLRADHPQTGEEDGQIAACLLISSAISDVADVSRRATRDENLQSARDVDPTQKSK